MRTKLDPRGGVAKVVVVGTVICFWRWGIGSYVWLLGVAQYRVGSRNGRVAGKVAGEGRGCVEKQQKD